MNSNYKLARRLGWHASWRRPWLWPYSVEAELWTRMMQMFGLSVGYGLRHRYMAAAHIGAAVERIYATPGPV